MKKTIYLRDSDYNWIKHEYKSLSELEKELSRNGRKGRIYGRSD